MYHFLNNNNISSNSSTTNNSNDNSSSNDNSDSRSSNSSSNNSSSIICVTLGHIQEDEASLGCLHQLFAVRHSGESELFNGKCQFLFVVVLSCRRQVCSQLVEPAFWEQ